jgi:hypothetical protein
MVSVVLWVVASGVGTLPAASAADQTAPERRQSAQPGKKSKGTENTLTGCVDEQNGQYVLISDRTREPVADLVADGFPTEGFAKHLGHTVTVRGTANPDGARPVFRVRSIQPVSDTCGPQHSAGN